MRTTILQMTCDCCGKIEKTDIEITTRARHTYNFYGQEKITGFAQEGINTQLPAWITLNQKAKWFLSRWHLQLVNEICNECYQEEEWLRQELIKNLPKLKKQAKDQIKKDPFGREKGTSTFFWKELLDLEPEGIPLLAAVFHREMIKD